MSNIMELLEGELLEGLYVSILAMLVVFFVLIAIALLMVILTRVVAFLQQEETRGAPVRTASQASSVPADGLDEDTVAAIMGALAMVMQGRSFRVASIAGYDVQTARWAMAGRQRLLKRN